MSRFKHAALAAVLLTSACGPSVDPDVNATATTQALTSPVSDSDTSPLASALVGTWEGPGCQSPGADDEGLAWTCETLRLDGDGGFSWQATSDYPEFSYDGRWDVWAVDDNRGQLVLEGASVLPVTLGSDVLRVFDEELTRSTPAALDAPSLVPVDPPEQLSWLPETTWYRSGGATWNRLHPVSITLDGGAYTADYDDGCVAEGLWGIRVAYEGVEQSGATSANLALQGAAMCAQPGATGNQTTAHLAIEQVDGALYVNGLAYSPEPTPDGYRLLGLEQQGLRIQTFVSVLKAGEVSQIEVRVINDGATPVDLSDLVVDVAPKQRAEDGGIRPAGEASVHTSPIVEIVEPGASTVVLGSFVAPSTEFAHIRISTEVAGDGQPWIPHATLSATVEP